MAPTKLVTATFGVVWQRLSLVTEPYNMAPAKACNGNFWCGMAPAKLGNGNVDTWAIYGIS